MLYFVFLLWSIEPDDICISGILKELDDGNRTCSCGVNCEETQYEVKLSSSDWPSQDYVVSIDYTLEISSENSFIHLNITKNFSLICLLNIGGSKTKIWRRKSLFWWIWIQRQFCSNWSLFSITKHKADL